MTPFLIAVRSENVKVIKYLLSFENIDVNTKAVF